MRSNPLSVAIKTLLLSGVGLATVNSYAVEYAEPTAQLETIEITASADASKEGLTPAYGYGDIATGSRIGVLGNQKDTETPFSTIAYTNQYIKNSQANSVGEVLKKDPTVQVARGFGNFQEAYIIRGFITDSDDTMYNGLYGILPRQYIASELFERVELLKGASSALNGATPSGGNIGGTISLLPKRAGNEPIREVTVSTQSFKNARVALDVGQRFGAEQQFGVRGNIVYQNGDTLIKNENKEIGLATVGLDYRRDQLRLSADLGYQNHEMDATRPSVTLSGVTAVPSAPKGNKNWSQPWTYSNEKDYFGSFRGEYDFNDYLTVYGAYGFRYGEEENRLANITVSNIDGTGTVYRFDNTREDVVNSGELGLRGKFDIANTHHKWTLSANQSHLIARNAYVMDFSNRLATNLYSPVDHSLPAVSSSAYMGGDLSDPRKTTENKLTSFALSDTVALFDDKLHVMGAVRHQKINQKTFNYGTEVLSSEYDQSKVTPSVGVIYQFIPNWSVYANYSENLSQGGTAPSTATNYGQTLKPYVAKQKEAGLKFDNGIATATLAIFDTKEQRGALDASNTYVAQGGNVHRGVELSGYYSPAEGVRVLGGINYLNAKQKDTGNSTTEGKYVIGAAKVSTNVGVEYDLPMLEGLTLTGNITHIGKRYADAINSLEVDSYTLFDLGARYKTQFYGHHVTLNGTITNLTDEKYWASVGGYPGYGYLNAGEPRAFKLAATFAF